ncbi:MAG: hypothetical protein IJI37_00045, partial [Opitutales bacterium]|nr:hypothetical protein [Opitutales bacterium]
IDSAAIKTDALLFSSKNGKIYFDPGLPFSEQKLEIPVSIFVKGSAKTLFEKIGYAKGESDAEGYYRGPSFTVEGTVSRPTNDLLDILTSATGAVKNALEKINFFKQ